MSSDSDLFYHYAKALVKNSLCDVSMLMITSPIKMAFCNDIPFRKTLTSRLLMKTPIMYQKNTALVWDQMVPEIYQAFISQTTLHSLISGLSRRPFSCAEEEY